MDLDEVVVDGYTPAFENFDANIFGYFDGGRACPSRASVRKGHGFKLAIFTHIIPLPVLRRAECYFRVADRPDTIWPPVGTIACSTGSAARLEQKVQKSSDSKSSNH